MPRPKPQLFALRFVFFSLVLLGIFASISWSMAFYTSTRAQTIAAEDLGADAAHFQEEERILLASHQ